MDSLVVSWTSSLEAVFWGHGRKARLHGNRFWKSSSRFSNYFFARHISFNLLLQLQLRRLGRAHFWLNNGLVYDLFKRHLSQTCSFAKSCVYWQSEVTTSISVLIGSMNLLYNFRMKFEITRHLKTWEGAFSAVQWLS